VDDLRLLHVDIDTMFVMSASGRIERENDPDRSTGPRVFFAGCPFGNLTRVRYDVHDRIAQRVVEVAAIEPPWRDPDVMPACADKIVELLSNGQPPAISHALIYKLPNGLKYEHSAPIVRGDSEEGRQMLARLADRGIPDYMQTAGFKGAGGLLGALVRCPRSRGCRVDGVRRSPRSQRRGDRRLYVSEISRQWTRVGRNGLLVVDALAKSACTLLQHEQVQPIIAARRQSPGIAFDRRQRPHRLTSTDPTKSCAANVSARPRRSYASSDALQLPRASTL